MSIASKITDVVAVINELATLKAALGIPEHATVMDVVAELKQVSNALGLFGSTAAEPAAPAAQAADAPQA